MNNTVNNGPHTDPRTEPGDRWITASWPVGEPDAEGWQAHADLNVNYHKSRGYRATLNVHHEQHSGIYVTKTMNLSINRTETEIHTRPAARFSRKVLGEVYDLALSQLRERFESADETVTPYFDAASPVFGYSGAPDRS